MATLSNTNLNSHKDLKWKRSLGLELLEVCIFFTFASFSKHRCGCLVSLVFRSESSRLGYDEFIVYEWDDRMSFGFVFENRLFRIFGSEIRLACAAILRRTLVCEWFPSLYLLVFPTLIFLHFKTCWVSQ